MKDKDKFGCRLSENLFPVSLKVQKYMINEIQGNYLFNFHHLSENREVHLSTNIKYINNFGILNDSIKMIKLEYIHYHKIYYV